MNLDRLIPEFQRLERGSQQGRRAILDSIDTKQLLPVYRARTIELWRQRDLRNIDCVPYSMLEDKQLRAIKCYGHCRSTSLVYWHLMGGKGPNGYPLRRFAQHSDGQLIHFWLQEKETVIDLTQDQTPLLPGFSYALGKLRKTTRAEHQGKFRITHSGKEYRLTDREWALLNGTLAMLWG